MIAFNLNKQQIFDLEFKWFPHLDQTDKSLYRDPYYNDDEFWYDVFDMYDALCGDTIDEDILHTYVPKEFLDEYSIIVDYFSNGMYEIMIEDIEELDEEEFYTP